MRRWGQAAPWPPSVWTVESTTQAQQTSLMERQSNTTPVLNLFETQSVLDLFTA